MIYHSNNDDKDERVRSSDQSNHTHFPPSPYQKSGQDDHANVPSVFLNDSEEIQARITIIQDKMLSLEIRAIMTKGDTKHQLHDEFMELQYELGILGQRLSGLKHE